MSIADNIARIRERISKTAQRARRNPDSILLMAVSKTVEPERIRQAYNAGIRAFGENRVQELSEKLAALQDLPDAEWYLIGHLQTNKVKRAAEICHRLDSVDSLRLAQKLNQAAQQNGKRLPVLIEVNVGGEENKNGLAPDSPELREVLQGMQTLEHLQVCGLMTIPPYTEDPQGARPYFRKLRDLRDAIIALKPPGIEMNVLSMGMSHDFEVAVEEGSTCVRVGTAIFGDRPKPQ
ncbi:MAG TPA: YggS family pyridoxal phosphate-dependent enzyme [Candidatus Angelobacter sp.]|nr:YggS family pyridoxal phosphate-dependent enzyme [Candidatus Angelobacter sp.]